MNETSRSTDRMLREREVLERVPLGRTTIWRMEKEGRFPRRRKLGLRAIGWLESEITEFLRSREVA